MDLATPLDPKTSGVGIKYYENTPNRYIWLNLTNLTKMLEIAVADLSQLFPEDSLILKSNLKEIKKSFFKSKVKYEQLFSSLDFLDVSAIGTTFDYILNEIGLFKSIELNEDISKRDDNAYNGISKFYKSSKKDVLLHKWKPVDKKLGNIIKAHNVKLVVIDLAMNPEDERSILSIIETNYNEILKALTE